MSTKTELFAVPESPPPEAWTLWRLDDNGHQEIVLEGIKNRYEAEILLKTYEQREHKQTYWLASRETR